MNLNDTQPTTVTQQDILKAEQDFVQHNEDMNALERLIGTFETYQTLNIVRPVFSSKADKTIAFELTMKRSA